jgi:uridine kinase
MAHRGTELAEAERHDIRSAICRRLGTGFMDGQKYILCIQGISTSGKSTMARIVHDALVASGIRTYLLALDIFYSHADGAIEDLFEYDFDNPSALNWDNVFRVVKAIGSDAPFIPRYARTSRGSELVGQVPNFMPDVLIVEGVNAFNVVEERIFNVAELDPIDSGKKVESEYVKNSLDLSPFKVIKIHLALCKSKAASIRVARDGVLRNLSSKDVLRRFNSQVWPAAERWGWSSTDKERIQVVHGMFNARAVDVMEELVYFFSGRQVGLAGAFDGHDMSEAFAVPCSGECVPSCGLVLRDSGDE